MFQTSSNIIPSLGMEEKEELLISNETEEFSELLTSLGVVYTLSPPYLQVGDPQRTQGWVLHLTIIKSQLTELISRVIPLLVSEHIDFKLAKNRSIAKDLIDGKLGALYLGKVINIYPSSDDQAAVLAARLIELTGDLRGPAVQTDFCLKNIVYTRYGAFQPILVADDSGTLIEHIYNHKGELVPDFHHIPFAFPKDIPWPFHNIEKPIARKQSKLQNGRYFHLSTIYGSFKGSVRKAIYFKRLWNIKACVIKEGKANMFCDEHGRDAIDRLKWQYEVCQELAGIVPIPKMFDFYTENGDAYIALEFIKGRSLHHWLGDEYQHRIWPDLPISTRRQILSILLQAITITHRMHAHGLIHRDLTTNNFIVSRHNKIVPIDLELAWSIRTEFPSPPFLLGTPGYMSPQQAKYEIPTIKDDIYSLGAMMLESLTNCIPIKLVCSDPQELYNRLLFFTQETVISNLVANCLSEDPIQRPDISELETVFTSLVGQYQEKRIISPNTLPISPNNKNLREIIQKAINGLVGQRLHDTKSRWELSSAHSIEENRDDEDEQEIEQLDGWHTGTAGLLWTIAIAKRVGFDISACNDLYWQTWQNLTNRYSNTQLPKDSSLYFGSGGIALAVAEGLKSGAILPDARTLEFLKKCLSVPSSEINFSLGVAGQGMALISAATWLPAPYVQQLLVIFATEITNQQTPDGSWNLTTEVRDKKRNFPLGIDIGISGILLFLLAIHEYLPDPNRMSVLKKALNWLTNDKKNQPAWKKIRKLEIQKTWASSRTAADLTLLMIRCYEVLGDTQYKKIAEDNLRTIPDNVFMSDFSLHQGITRIGELYLEAYRVFRDPIWLDKAGRIANTLLHCFIPRNDYTGYWVVSTDLHPIADLFRGNSGVIHFLLRFTTEGKTSSPFSPLKDIAIRGNRKPVKE